MTILRLCAAVLLPQHGNFRVEIMINLTPKPCGRFFVCCEVMGRLGEQSDEDISANIFLLLRIVRLMKKPAPESCVLGLLATFAYIKQLHSHDCK